MGDWANYRAGDLGNAPVEDEGATLCRDCHDFDPCPCDCGMGFCRKWSQWAEAGGWCVDWSAE